MLIILALVVSCNLQLPLAAEKVLKKVIIYSGPGTDQESVIQTQQTLKRLLGSPYEVLLMDNLLQTNWDQTTSLLVMPGGRDIPYSQSLNGPGNQKIKKFVEKGGAYLGICAGAYYAAESIEFAKGDPTMEVVASRELGFFKGLVKGPAFLPFDYTTPAGRRVVQVRWPKGSLGANSEKTFSVFYKGGGYFAHADQVPGVEILGAYQDLKDKNPAIVRMRVGSGRVLLSGVHFEYSPDSMYNRSKELFARLKKSENGRQELLMLIKKGLDL